MSNTFSNTQNPQQIPIFGRFPAAWNTFSNTVTPHPIPERLCRSAFRGCDCLAVTLPLSCFQKDGRFFDDSCGSFMPENPENYLPEVCTILTILKSRRKCPSKRFFLSARRFSRSHLEIALQAVTSEINGIAAHVSNRSFLNLPPCRYFFQSS